jgi:hypothetical protein
MLEMMVQDTTVDEKQRKQNEGQLRACIKKTNERTSVTNYCCVLPQKKKKKVRKRGPELWREVHLDQKALIHQGNTTGVRSRISTR